jgi:molybdate/tungstate transport system substrate-binding protein
MQTASGIDYGFVYRSQAEDRNLPYVSLPPQINLGDPAMQQRYESVEVDVSRGDKTVRIRGGLIAFALTTIRGSENEPLAREFVKLVLSERGRQILRDCRLKVLDPPIVPKGVKLPGYLDGQAEVR